MGFPTKHLVLGALAAAIASAAPHSDAYAYSHDDAVIKRVIRQCVAGTGNRAFCNCIVDAIKKHLPPKYAVLYTISLGSNQVRLFATSKDLPQYIEDKLSDATTFCRSSGVR